MFLLILVSLLWAFSFGLIKGRLAGLDGAFISAVRLILALVVFLPFLRLDRISTRAALQLIAIGALQFGVMYLAYNESFRFLNAYEVALFTITTPIFVTLFADALDRTLRPRALIAAIVAIIGTAVVVFRSSSLSVTVSGLLLVQLSNLAFATGQVLYTRVKSRHPEANDREIFALPYAGAVIVASTAMLILVDRDTLNVTATQWWTLAYLGVLASGLGFFLWNVGATRVTPGVLAVMNNAKVPLGVACSLLFFGEQANLPALAASLALLGIAVWLARR